MESVHAHCQSVCRSVRIMVLSYTDKGDEAQRVGELPTGSHSHTQAEASPALSTTPAVPPPTRAQVPAWILVLCWSHMDLYFKNHCLKWELHHAFNAVSF